MRDKLGNILSSGECISEEMMLNYIEGKVSSAEQQRIEKHLLECEFCNDAFEGLSASGHSEVRESLKELDRKIDERLVRPEGKIIQLKRIYRIAAVIVLCAVFGGGLYYMQSIKKSERIFTENFTPYHDTINPAIITAPPAKSNLEKDLEKIPPGSLRQVKKEKPQKENTPKFTFDGSTVTVTTDSKKEEDVSSNYSISPENQTAPAMPSQKDEIDKTSAAEEVQSAKAAVADSKKPSPGYGNTEEKQVKNLSYKAASKETRRENNEVSLESSNATDSIFSKSNALLLKGKKDYEAKNYTSRFSIFRLPSDSGALGSHWSRWSSTRRYSASDTKHDFPSGSRVSS